MNQKPRFDIVVCYDSNFGMSYDNVVPWNIPTESKYFDTLTTFNDLPNKKSVVIMDDDYFKLFFKSKPLLNRYNIIVSQTIITTITQITINNFDTYYVPDIDHALNKILSLKNTGNIWVIGGKKLYDVTIHHPNLRNVYTTIINKVYDTNIKFFNLTKYGFIIEEETLLDNICDNIYDNIFDMESTENVSIRFVKWMHNVNLNTLNTLDTHDNSLDGRIEILSRRLINYILDWWAYIVFHILKK